jgi:SAM-dependent methyltransferase
MQGVKPDINYRIEQFPLLDERQTFFYLRRTEEAVIEAAGRIGPAGENRARLLDVGCGLGTQAAKLWLRGWEAHGIDASESMLRLGQWRSPVVHKSVRMVRGVAESLPFQDSSFDLVMCQGAMDHFADPRQFVREAARLLKPGGRLIIALANYESLSCRIGHALHSLMGLIGVVTPARYRFWGIPEDHTFKGSYRLMKGLTRGRLRLVKMYGASLFLFLPPWRGLLELLSFPAAFATFRVMDRLAHRFPIAADVVIGVWQKDSTPSAISPQRGAPADGKRRSTAVPSYLARR